jgi:hypothetical protein
MAPKHPTVQSRSYSFFVLLIVSALLLASCGVKLPASATVVPPIPTSTPEVIQATQAPATPGPATVDTPVPPTPTPEVVQPVATPVLATPTLEAAVTPTPEAIPTNAASASSAAGSITFTPGTTATVVQGSLQPGQVMAYTLEASQSQPMILIMDSPNNDVTLGVFGYDGSLLLDPANKYTNWQGVLPRTERYTIQVIGGAVLENFTLTVKIAQIVNFASGTSSTTLNGTTVNGYLFDYSLYCSAGQTMTANLNVSASIATLDIFGLSSGSTLLYASSNANTWSGVLPETQDYVIEVIPTNNQVVNYALSVSCTGAAVSIPTPVGTPVGTAVVQPPSNPGTITFAHNTTAAEVHGTVGAGQVVSYTVQAPQYSPLVLVLDSPSKDVFLGVLYPDGSTFLSRTKQYKYWQWRIPETGLYTIQVFGGALQSQYSLTVKIPEIVYFAPGASSIQLYGDTNLGFVRSYAFYLSFGQTLTASLDIPSDKAYLDVFGLETGSVLSYTSKSSTWNGVLPATQMYVIEVIPRGGYLVGYGLTVTVK